MRVDAGWSPSWRIVRRGAELATLASGGWPRVDRLDVRGRSYELRTSRRGDFELRPAGDDLVLARIERLGFEQWTLTAGGRIHRFRRVSLWDAEANLLAARPAGPAAPVDVAVAPPPSGVPDPVEVDLPGLDDLQAAFATAAVLLLWGRSR